MKLFICSSSRSRMPYLKGYKEVVGREISQTIVWDRFNDENPGHNLIIYRDGKTGPRRGVWDYFKFSRFVKKNVPKDTRSVVIFSAQLFVFCFLYLRNFDNLYLDLRDWHPSIKFMPEFMKRKIKKVFVSSIKFAELMKLPEEKVVISHNCWTLNRCSVDLPCSDRIRISYIGSVRDYIINSNLIRSLGGVPGIELWFYGDGPCLAQLQSVARSLKCSNVLFYGRYDAKDEDKFYLQSTMINSLIPPVGVNNRSLLTNRLYNAVLNSRPLLAFEGTYLSEIVEEFGLGLVVSNFENLNAEIVSFLSEFEFENFEANCDRFLAYVAEDMRVFNSCVADI